jgi:peptide/nickel transport system substrate-binding protein
VISELFDLKPHPLYIKGKMSYNNQGKRLLSNSQLNNEVYLKKETKNMKRKLLGVLLVLTVTIFVALSGCTRDNAGDNGQMVSNEANTLPTNPVDGGRIRIGVSQDIDSLDPHIARSAGTREVLFNIYEGLVKPNSNGEIVGAIAKEYQISDDLLVYTFTLREGVMFHNGNYVTAKDVKYSIERLADTSSGPPLVPAFSVIKEVNIVDEGIVEIVLREPDSGFLPQLTVAIVPVDVLDLETNPVGTGPFMFHSRIPGDRIVLERFDDYWGENAHLEQVEFRIMADPDMTVTYLNGGSIDMALRLTAAQIAQLSDSFYVERGTVNLAQGLYLNNAIAPLDNLLVRQALNYAVNQEEIMQIVGGGYGVRIGTSMLPGIKYYFDESFAQYYEHNIERAKELLAQAGYPDGFDLEIVITATSPIHVDTGQVIVEQLRLAGINATIRLVEWSVWLEEVHGNRDYMATVIGVDATTLSARAMLERFTSTASGNFVNFSNEEYDRVFEKTIFTADQDERRALYHRLQEILVEQAANVYIQDNPHFVAIRNNFSGYVFYPIYVQNLATMYMTESAR